MVKKCIVCCIHNGTVVRNVQFTAINALSCVKRNFGPQNEWLPERRGRFALVVQGLVVVILARQVHARLRARVVLPLYVTIKVGS